MTRSTVAACVQCGAMNELTRMSIARLVPKGHDGSEAPAIAALTELIRSESALASQEEPDLAAQRDPGHLWLLWFAIGATDAVCQLVGREADSERNVVFRQVVNVIFGDERVRSSVDPVSADKRLIELFESAGAEAVMACVRGDKRLGYYLEALRVSAGHDHSTRR